MPLFWLSLAFIIGIGTAPLLHLPSKSAPILTIISVLFAIFEIYFSRRHTHPFLDKPLFRIPLALILAFGLLGMITFQQNLPGSAGDDIYRFSETSGVAVLGLVSFDPSEMARYTSATITSKEITLGDETHPVMGKVRLTLPQGFPIAYGDVVIMRGTLNSTVNSPQKPFDSRDGREKVFVDMDFPQVEIIARGQGNPIISTLFRIRERAYKVIFDMIPFPESAVLSGILLGIETAIPDYLWNGYRASGIAHIIAISGFNISIITHLLYRYLSDRKNLKLALPITILTVILYTILVGADTPVVRAAIMASIALPASRIGRRSISIHNLVIAAALMLVINPYLLWDISFQLSFLATLALQVMADPIIHWVISILKIKDEKDKQHPLLDAIITTLCASFAVFPILFRMTGTISRVSILANILVAPLQPFIMLGGGAAVIIGLISPIASWAIGIFVWPLLAFCNQVAIRLSANPASTVYLPAWVYGVSLFFSISTLAFFSTKQVISLSKPTITSRTDPI